jgi:hypothetical protein
MMYKVLVLVSLVVVTGCVKLPNFPTFFYSQQDLRDQEREIDNSFNRSK